MRRMTNERVHAAGGRCSRRLALLERRIAPSPSGAAGLGLVVAKRLRDAPSGGCCAENSNKIIHCVELPICASTRMDLSAVNV